MSQFEIYPVDVHITNKDALHRIHALRLIHSVKGTVYTEQYVTALIGIYGYEYIFMVDEDSSHFDIYMNGHVESFDTLCEAGYWMELLLVIDYTEGNITQENPDAVGRGSIFYKNFGENPDAVGKDPLKKFLDIGWDCISKNP